MEGDLQVVYTVPQVQVRRAVEKWHKAIKKELDNLFNTGILRRITMKQALELQRQGKLRLVPSKGVYTLKPPDTPENDYDASTGWCYVEITRLRKKVLARCMRAVPPLRPSEALLPTLL